MNIIKHIRRPLLTAGNEASFGLLGKNKWIKKELEKYKNKHPFASGTSEVVGNLASGILPGGAGVKVLSKIGKLGKTLNAHGLKGILAKGAIYGL
jgi:hypothetical protein